MFTSINRTVFDIPLTWNRTRFEASRVKCQKARKLIEASVNAQFNKQLRDVYYQKLDIEKDISESEERLINHGKKVRALDNLTEVAAQSLEEYFDQRMNNVRTAIQEHWKAIQQILREESEHWNEIHTAIDQNLITSDDIHPPNKGNQETSLADMHTIDEVDEEEHTSKLLNNKTVTPLLTQMIRKSRLQSNRPSIIEENTPSSLSKKLIESKAERMSFIIPITSARRTLHVIDTTFVVKLEESKNTEPNTSEHVEVPPIESIPSTDVDIIPSYSQPNLPARLYFSPTLLQDDDESEVIQPVLSTIDQNQTYNEKPKLIHRRFGQTFVLDDVKTEEMNKTQDSENIRPKISEEIPFMFNPDPSVLMEKQSLNESHQFIVPDQQKSVVYSKRRTRAAPAVTKIESEPIHATRRTARKPKPIKEIEPIQRPTRKRKQSISDDGNDNTVALRKKKKTIAPPAEKTTTRKTRAKKTKEIPIREPSPLPEIDRSKHYSTSFSTRSHRVNNLTLSTTTMTHDNDEDDDNNNNNKSKQTLKRLRTKSMGRTRQHDDDGGDQTISSKRSTGKQKQAKTRTKSMISTRNRKKNKD